MDSVRCITNASTGELGVLLSEHLAKAGWRVSCWKSMAAVFRDPKVEGVAINRFTTNTDLFDGMLGEAAADPVDFVFHAAALCDYEVASIEAGEGTEPSRFSKIPSDYPEILLTLKRAPKVLPQLKGIFPRARIVGWKLEFDGDRSNALEKGARQIQRDGTALTVVNGSAYGAGFGVLSPRGECAHLASKVDLCEWLVRWTGTQRLD